MVVVGAGPTGLMLAAELALGGAKVQLLDERVDMPNITRAFAVHARTLELLDARGMADELLTRGVPVYEIAPPGGVTLNLRELPTRFGMLLVVPQSGTEQVLQMRVDDLGVPVVRGAEVVGLTQDDDGVTVQCADGTSIATKYVVGCDGAHSTVRQLVGIEFTGKQYETHILLADVHLTRAPQRDADRCDQRARCGADDPVRRRLVPRHRLGPAAGTGAAEGAGHASTRSATRSTASPARTTA